MLLWLFVQEEEVSDGTTLKNLQLSLLYTPITFWVFSPDSEDETNLDRTENRHRKEVRNNRLENLCELLYPSETESTRTILSFSSV